MARDCNLALQTALWLLRASQCIACGCTLEVPPGVSPSYPRASSVPSPCARRGAMHCSLLLSLTRRRRDGATVTHGGYARLPASIGRTQCRSRSGWGRAGFDWPGSSRARICIRSGGHLPFAAICHFHRDGDRRGQAYQSVREDHQPLQSPCGSRSQDRRGAREASKGQMKGNKKHIKRRSFHTP
jgi:hypothetical protein